MHKEPKTLN